MNHTLGQKMKFLRENRLYTQTQISDLLHVGRSSYANYEIGKREPSVNFLVTLADFYQVTVDYLVRSSFPADLAEYQHYIQLLTLFKKLDPEAYCTSMELMTCYVKKKLWETKKKQDPARLQPTVPTSGFLM